MTEIQHLWVARGSSGGNLGKWRLTNAFGCLSFGMLLPVSIDFSIKIG
jgi:hypothetical protein